MAKLFVSGLIIRIIEKQSLGLLLLGKYLMDVCIMHIKTGEGLALSRIFLLFSNHWGLFIFRQEKSWLDVNFVKFWGKHLKFPILARNPFGPILLPLLGARMKPWKDGNGAVDDMWWGSYQAGGLRTGARVWLAAVVVAALASPRCPERRCLPPLLRPTHGSSTLLPPPPPSSPASSLPPPPMPLSCRTSAILLPPGHQQPEEFNLNFGHLAENSLAWVHHRSPASSLACCIPQIWAVDYIPLHHYHSTQYPPTISNKQSTPWDLIILLLPYCHILDHIVWGCFILFHFKFTFT